MLCDAVVEVLITRNGAPLALRSAGHRYFTPKQREALTVLYPTCAVDGCTTPAVACDAHHVIPVSKGGETTVANAIHLCNFHHNQLHAGHLKIIPNPELTRGNGQGGGGGVGQEVLPGLIIVPTSTGGHGVNRTTRPQAPAQEPEPVNLTDRTAWNTSTDDDGSAARWATPGVDPNTTKGWGYDHRISQASKDAWDRAGIDANGWGLPGVVADDSRSSEEEKTEKENTDEPEPAAKPTPGWGEPRPTSESMTAGRRYEVKGGPDMEAAPAHGPVDYIDMGATPPQICFAA